MNSSSDNNNFTSGQMSSIFTLLSASVTIELCLFKITPWFVISYEYVLFERFKSGGRANFFDRVLYLFPVLVLSSRGGKFCIGGVLTRFPGVEGFI